MRRRFQFPLFAIDSDTPGRLVTYTQRKSREVFCGAQLQRCTIEAVPRRLCITDSCTIEPVSNRFCITESCTIDLVPNRSCIIDSYTIELVPVRARSVVLNRHRAISCRAWSIPSLQTYKNKYNATQKIYLKYSAGGFSVTPVIEQRCTFFFIVIRVK